MLSQQFPFFVGDDGRKLEKIADIEHLHPAEWEEWLPAEMPEYGIDGVERVGAHHADLIDDQQFQFLEQFAFVGVETDIPEQALRV